MAAMNVEDEYDDQVTVLYRKYAGRGISNERYRRHHSTPSMSLSRMPTRPPLAKPIVSITSPGAILILVHVYERRCALSCAYGLPALCWPAPYVFCSLRRMLSTDGAVCGRGGDAVAEPPVTFAGLLRKLRTGLRLTQEELAEAAGLSPRSVSDLERGIATTPRRDTVRLLADALHLTGPARAEFEAVARGRTVTAGAAAGRVAAPMRALPRDIGSFTGRRQELGELIAGVAGSGGVVGIHAIGGMAGVGKTAFAVHAAHRLAEQFPGGQIFLPLHGHTPGQQPVEPVDALASLLLTLGLTAGQIPPGVEARMALWRDRVAGQQLLLILDDAASSEQVRPLLPGTSGSLVLVTSRRHLSALDDATVISLDTLPPAEAAALLVRLAGRPGLSLDDPAVAEITRLCGYLPLAIGMVARQLHHHPAWTLAGHAAELTAARDRLELMATENLSVAAAFDLSYRDLTADQQRLFRRLGLHPGTDVDAYAAAALDGTDLAAARRDLEALYDQYLLAEPAAGRYRLHDLIREHARALAGRVDPVGDRDRATGRLLDYYQYAAAAAESWLARQTRPRLAAAAGPGPAAVPALADRKQALAWARSERTSLLACLDHAAATGRQSSVIALAAGLAGLLLNDGPWAEAFVCHSLAVRAAQAIGDRLARANALNDLGMVQLRVGDNLSGPQVLEEALGIYRDLGDRLGQANALTNLAGMRGATGDYPGVASALQEALDIYGDLGDRPGQANALRELGMMKVLAADYPGAVQDLEQAQEIYRDLGVPSGRAHALTFLGEVRRLTGDYPGAVEALQEALSIYQDSGNQGGRASVFICLGDVRRLTGDYSGAVEALEEALSIYQDLGSPSGQANASATLADVLRLTGDYPGAARALDQALEVCREIGLRGGEVMTLNQYGTLHRARGDLPQAASCHQQALALAREIGTALEEAHALAGLGRCALAEGRAVEAKGLLRQSLEIFERIGTAEAAEVSAELDALTDAKA
jgi:tetratricopeptide (TPR) repeat protein/transcriptional regulator with XRE-family HTH domain